MGTYTPKTRFGVCSRNLELKRDENKRKVYDNDGKPSEFSTNNFWYASEKYGIEERLPAGFAVQGELVGPKIQGNYEKVGDIEYYIFDVYSITESRYLTPKERKDFCDEWGFPHVPVLGYKKILELYDLKGILDFATGPGMNKGVRREGLVFKAVDGKTSFKAISNEYLLKYEK